jgi:hypothetical protein
MSVAELKLKQRLLKEQLSLIDSKASKVSNMLYQRKMAHLKSKEPSPEVMQGRRTRTLLREAAEANLQLAGPGPFEPARMKRAEVCSDAMGALRLKHLKHHLDHARELEAANQRRRPPGPGRAGAYRRNAIPETLFAVRHARNELPCSIEHVSFGLQLSWVAPLNVLDYEVTPTHSAQAR